MTLYSTVVGFPATILLTVMTETNDDQAVFDAALDQLSTFSKSDIGDCADIDTYSPEIVEQVKEN